MRMNMEIYEITLSINEVRDCWIRQKPLVLMEFLRAFLKSAASRSRQAFVLYQSFSTCRTVSVRLEVS